MIARTWRKAGLAAVLVSVTATSLIPGISRAATPTTCLNGWGQTHPNVWCEPGFVGSVTPIDMPYRNTKGVLYVRGITAPASSVRVLATDGVLTFAKDVTSSAVDDPEADRPAGSFSAELEITELGTHKAKAGALPGSLDPDDRGKTVLTVSAIVNGTSFSTTVNKYAATYKDTFAPAMTGPSGPEFFNTGSPNLPPTYWCHFDPFNDPFGLVGTVSFGIIPGGVCAEPNQRNGDETGCNLYLIVTTITDLECPTGQVNIHGTVFDDGSGAWGKGSEIADVRLTVTKGGAVIEDESIIQLRRGPQAWFGHVVKIDDYEPNFDTCDPQFKIDVSGCYNFKVTVTDAWGNTSSAESGNVAVMPF